MSAGDVLALEGVGAGEQRRRHFEAEHPGRLGKGATMAFAQ